MPITLRHYDQCNDHVVFFSLEIFKHYPLVGFLTVALPLMKFEMGIQGVSIGKFLVADMALKLAYSSVSCNMPL